MQKIGLDDYLKEHSVQDFQKLPRVSVDDPRFGKEKKWHEKWLQEKEAKKRNAELSEIDINGKPLPVILKAVRKAVEKGNEPRPSLYRYGGSLSRIEFDDAGAPFVASLNVESLPEVLAERIRFTKTIRKGKKSHKIDIIPPKYVISGILGSLEIPAPVLKRLVTVPVFGPDGSLRTKPGFSSSSGILFLPKGSLDIPLVSKKPSKKEIEKAKAILCGELLGGFPFENLSDKAQTFAMLLQHPARALIKGSTPLYSVDAPMQGTGKTLLVSVIIRIWQGEEVSPMAEARSDDEGRKRLFSALRTSSAFIFIDNLKSTVSSPALELALTSDSFTERILGVSKVSSVPVQCQFIATGNNMQFSAEMIRRTVRIRLNARMPQPWTGRTFKHPNLKEWVTQNRGRLMWAAYTLIQAWIAAGRPKGSEKIGSFESWSEVMGGILDVCGIPGFLKGIQQFYAEADTETGNYEEFVQDWFRAHGYTLVKTSQLLPLAARFSSEFEAGGDRSLQTKLGILLNHLRGRVIGNFTVHKSGAIGGIQRWQLLPRAGVKSGGLGGLPTTDPEIKKTNSIILKVPAETSTKSTKKIVVRVNRKPV